MKKVTKEVEDELNSKDKGRVEEDFNKNSNSLELQAKKVITNWRATPGKISRKGDEIKW